MLATVDARDIFYAVIGFGLLALTLQPAISHHRFVNIPLFYVILGVLLVWFGAPVLDPRVNDLSAMIIEHGSEIIVIISLAGAGLAIDTKGSWKNWNAAFRLLMIAMPITIAAIYFTGTWILGLPAAAAMLLAAALTPTDPVLARSIQVSPPGEDETPMEVALTAEAGLNDGLAFPFVYMAIILAGIAAANAGVDGSSADAARGYDNWFWMWFGWDLVYRVAAGWIVGYVSGLVFTRLALSTVGDASTGRWNSIVMILGATFASYGLAEAVDGYGFLAVFAATRAGRDYTRDTENEAYTKYVHHGADQLESILLVLLLIWFGMFLAAGSLDGLTLNECLFAAALIFIIRPIAGLVSMIGFECPNADRIKVAFFGVRGMGSIFYIAYAQNHAAFVDIDSIWRVAGLVIAMSILVHGFASNFVIRGSKQDSGGGEKHPVLGDDADEPPEAIEL